MGERGEEGDGDGCRWGDNFTVREKNDALNVEMR